jgi:hypothetical protein
MDLGHNPVIAIGRQPYWTPQDDMPIGYHIVHILQCSPLLVDRFYAGADNK